MMSLHGNVENSGGVPLSFFQIPYLRSRKIWNFGQIFQRGSEQGNTHLDAVGTS